MNLLRFADTVVCICHDLDSTLAVSVNGSLAFIGPVEFFLVYTACGHTLECEVIDLCPAWFIKSACAELAKWVRRVLP